MATAPRSPASIPEEDVPPRPTSWSAASGDSGNDGQKDGEADAELAEIRAMMAEERDWPIPTFSTGARAAAAIAKATLDVFFSKVEVVNDENIPDDGPVILFGNHNNQFVDGMCMMAAAKRPVRFIVAEVSMHKPVVGSLARMVSAVPVTRPQDLARPGPGRVTRIDLAARTLHGSPETRFTEIPTGHLVTIAKVGQFTVAAAPSDDLIEFKPLPPGETVDLTQLEGAGHAYKVTPRVQQSEMFQAVFDGLRRGDCIGIFPEGGSHDRTELLPLKAGVAIMALGALAQGIPVSLVPVGINYFGGHVFRSKVFIDCGKPIEIDPRLVKMYRDKASRREACAVLLRDMRQSLDFACLTAPDFETLKVVRTARRMYQNKVELSPKEYIDLNHRFSFAFKLWQDRPEFQELMHDVHEYLEFCRSQGLKDKEVRDLPPLGSLRVLLTAVFDVAVTCGMVLFVMPLILPGVLVNLPVPLYIRKHLPRALDQARKGSSVKIAARDVSASQQIIMAMKIIPVLHVVYSAFFIVFFWVTWDMYRLWFGEMGQLFTFHAFWVLPLLFLFLGPYYSFYFCPWMGETMVRKLRLLPRYVLCIRSFFSRSKRQPAELLRVERKKLTVRIQEFVERNIGEVPGWKDARIINRAKIVKSRSRSIKQVARGDLSSGLPNHVSFAAGVRESPSMENLARLSFSSD